MSLENFIYSKHFVYKQSLFSTSKKLLTLKFSGLSLDSLPYTPSSYETIDFSEITPGTFGHTTGRSSSETKHSAGFAWVAVKGRRNKSAGGFKARLKILEKVT